MSDIQCSVIRQTSVTLPPYTVQIEVDENRKVVNSSCNCLAGVGSNCKHIGALVVYINTENSDTKTNKECEWRKPNSAGKCKYTKGKTIEELFPIKRAKCCENTIDRCDDILEIIKNVNCPLKLMLEAEDTSFCRQIIEGIFNDVVKDADFNSTDSSIPRLPLKLPIYNDIKVIFSVQDHSEVLKYVASVPIIFTNNCCQEFYESYSSLDCIDICYNSLIDKQKWKEFRQFRITASRCYEIYTYSKSDWSAKSVKYFWPKSFKSKYTRHGIEFEDEARKLYCNLFKTHVQEIGLVVFSKEPWLAASPDGVIMKNGLPVKLLEIKCPYKGKELSAKEVASHCSFLKNDNGNITLKTKHAYFAQVQLGMALLNVTECDFVIFCSFDKTLINVNVKFDNNFAQQLILKVKHNYFQKMLHFICENKL